jgi:ATP-dependent DNA helicase RecQ
MTASPESPTLAALEKWRAGVAETMAIPAYAVIPDGVLRAIALARPESRLDLARIRGVGPRLLAKFADEILRVLTIPEPSPAIAPDARPHAKSPPEL